MIIGERILELGLIRKGKHENLKHSTYDLTIGEIIPIGQGAVQKRRKKDIDQRYFVEPREMVWVVSKEEFCLPGCITGVATLRTTFTKLGLLALNVGIVDPFYTGPISTALINFSDRPREIGVGDKFFRVIFMEHDDTSNYRSFSHSMPYDQYVLQTENAAALDFASSFLNIPDFDDKFYYRRFWAMVRQGITSNLFLAIPVFILLIVIVWFFIQLGFIDFLVEKYTWIIEQKKKFGL